LIEQKLHPMRQQRGSSRNKQGLVAGAPQRLAPAT
jgi:hypothetical protein